MAKQIGVKVIKSLNMGFYGSEPVYDRELSSKELQDALTWYNYNMDLKDGNGFLVQYLNNTGADADLIKAVKSGNDKFFPVSLYKLARIINLGGKLPDYAMKWIDSGLADGFKKYKGYKGEEVFIAPKKLNERNVNLLWPIEAAIDKKDKKFDLVEYLTDQKVVADTTGRKIMKFYDDELKIAKTLQPTELETAAEIASYVKYLEKIVTDTKIFCGIDVNVADVPKVKKPRKPRAKKIIPPEKKVEKVQYLPEFAELGLKSIHPKEIIGKKSVWCYDTKYGKLWVARAATDAGLDIKGTTVMGFDEKTSEAKRIGRKAKQVLPFVLQGGKVQLKKMFTTINTANVEVTGRINGDTIILRVEK